MEKKFKGGGSLVIYFIALLFLCAVVVYAVIGTSSEERNTALIDACDVLVAVVSGICIVYQLKSDNDSEKKQHKVEQANFIFEYNVSFIENEKMNLVEQYLESSLTGGYKDNLDLQGKDRQLLINYLVYLEGLATCVLEGIMSLSDVDNLFAYRFFLAMNHIEVQDIELVAFSRFYRGCYKLYEMWYRYRESKWVEDDDFGIPLMEHPLRETEHFADYVKEFYTVKTSGGASILLYEGKEVARRPCQLASRNDVNGKVEFMKEVFHDEFQVMMDRLKSCVQAEPMAN